MNLPHRTSAPRHAVLYFDFSDPCSYIAAARVPAACAEAGVSLTLEPIDASGLARACRPPAAGSPEWSRIEGLAREWGLELRPPARYPFDARPLLRACLFVRDRSGQEAMVAVAERLWQEVWGAGADPADPAIAVRAGREAAVPENLLRAGLDDERVAALLERVTRRALERGVRTVPAVQLESERFEGLDGLVEFESRLRLRPLPAARESAAFPPDWMVGG